jgi:hypothetical protein
MKRLYGWAERAESGRRGSLAACFSFTRLTPLSTTRAGHLKLAPASAIPLHWRTPTGLENCSIFVLDDDANVLGSRFSFVWRPNGFRYKIGSSFQEGRTPCASSSFEIA